MQTICNEDILLFLCRRMSMYGRSMLIVQMNKFINVCIHTHLYNYVENCKTGYKTCISFFHYNDKKITKASAKYKWYKCVSDPTRH